MKLATRIGVLFAGLATMAPSCSLPTVFSRAVLVEHDGAGFSLLSISGTDFRAPETAAFVTLTFADQTTQVIQSLSPQIRLWNVDHITVDLPPNSTVTKAKVTTKIGGSVATADVDHYRWDDFDLSVVDPGSSPMVTAADDHGRIWANTEFHERLVYWDPNDEELHSLASYSPPVAAIYWTTYLGVAGPTTKAIFGESVIYDGHGRMWFTEGGHEPNFVLPSSFYPDHSRIIAVDTATLETRVLAVPGNRNSVVGVTWDEVRGRVWFAQVTQGDGSGGWIEPAKLISFDPDVLPFEDSAFDWEPTADCDVPPGAQSGVCANAPYHPCSYPRDCILADRICPPGAPDDAPCYREHPLPAPPTVLMPAEIAVYPDGSVWFASFIGGGYIGRLIPETGETKLFPLSATPSGGVPALWDLRVAPNGDIVAHAYVGGTVARLKPSFFEQDCSQLVHPDGVTNCAIPPPRDPECYNPCIEETSVPVAQFFAVTATEDVVMDRGYLRPNGEYIHFPPLLITFPTAHTPAETYGAALGNVHYVSPEGVVWGADQFGRRLTRLTPLPPP